jgi:hypothetical protein
VAIAVPFEKQFQMLLKISIPTQILFPFILMLL